MSGMPNRDTSDRVVLLRRALGWPDKTPLAELPERTRQAIDLLESIQRKGNP